MLYIIDNAAINTQHNNIRSNTKKLIAAHLTLHLTKLFLYQIWYGYGMI